MRDFVVLSNERNRGWPWPERCWGMTPMFGERWFDAEALRDRATARHGTAGATCEECGVWRWFPLGWQPSRLGSEVLPPLLDVPELDAVDIAASPEWFGSGGSSFRETLLRRELAQMLVEASPRDFVIVEPEWAPA